MENANQSQLNSSMENEEYEDILVYVQCESENMNEITNLENFKIIGVDTEKPVMTINGKVIFVIFSFTLDQFYFISFVFKLNWYF